MKDFPGVAIQINIFGEINRLLPAKTLVIDMWSCCIA